MPNASALEIWWTVLALPGLLLSLVNVWGAVAELHDHWADGLAELGWVGILKVTLVLLMALMVLGSGLIAMLTPPPPSEANREAATWIAGFLMVLDGCILGLAIAFWVERRYVVPRIARRDRGDRA